MKHVIHILLGALGFMSLCFGFVGTVKATEKKEETGMGFTYVNKVPENQVKEGNFFDLMMVKGQEQVLETDLTNLTDQDITINVSVSNATTTEAGVIDYSPSQLLNTANLTYGLTDVIEAPERVTIPKNGKTTLKLRLKMPAEEIQGVILGGIQLQQAMPQSKTSKETVSINNEYAYVYSVSLREMKEESPFDFKSNATKVNAKDQSIVSLNFSNEAPRIIKGMTVETLVTPRDSDEVLEERRFEEMKMAPNSVISIPLDVALPSGDYRTKTTVKVEDESWEWVEEFSVGETKPVRQTVESSPESADKSFNWLPLVIIASALVIGTGVLYMVIIKN
ncbi:WxL protein peptidoglycan domain-containing protein [uncultured Vagococcus sp.]|uniref:DUF916 domain-containing protein n=1 Tax=uncultured Vagococcus sp. TaxID=189676 RepID=UPI0028D23DA8|nr:DUF916 domain-containing protein [uncultured Vagococcus sp.]